MTSKVNGYDVVVDAGSSANAASDKIDPDISRYPHCIVWTPIPLITWILPFIGHMGIASCAGVIRDFAGPYMVGEDSMAFGEPTKYWQVNLNADQVSPEDWDRAVTESCEEYKHRVHILCWDNCHSHVAYALNRMRFRGQSWSAFSVWLYLTWHSTYVSPGRLCKTYAPFCVLAVAAAVIAIVVHFVL